MQRHGMDVNVVDPFCLTTIIWSNHKWYILVVSSFDFFFFPFIDAIYFLYYYYIFLCVLRRFRYANTPHLLLNLITFFSSMRIRLKVLLLLSFHRQILFNAIFPLSFSFNHTKNKVLWTVRVSKHFINRKTSLFWCLVKYFMHLYCIYSHYAFAFNS